MNLEAFRRSWGEWEIRLLLVGSLSLQMFLLFAGGLRKRSVVGWLRMLLWLAYLLADSIAIYALGNLSQNEKLNGSHDEEMHIFAFWAPFLILHLGGQDTITAFAMEDNELWLRHLLNLMSQVALAVYVYWKSRPSSALLTPAVIMFVSGVIKYGERTWALRSASMSSLRGSMLTPPDAGPNYPRFVDMFESSRDAGLNAQIVIVLEQPPEDGTDVQEEWIPYEDLMYRSYKLFQTFRRVFVDLILSFQDRTDSLSVFRQLKMEQAFKVVEIELALMYDSLHSKCSVIHGPVGRSLRVFTLAAPVVSLALFAEWHGHGGAGGSAGAYKKIDVVISYVLLAGAVFLETYAVLLMIVSPWTYAYLRERRNCRFAATLLFWPLKFFQPENRPRWSNKMAQYNLISYCLKDQPRWYTRALEKLEWGGYNIRAKTMWDGLWHTNHTEVLPSLKMLVFKQLKHKASSTTDPVIFKEFGEHRGQWVLQRNGCYQQLGWSVEAEFDESILLWHTATDLCFYDSSYYSYDSSRRHAPAGCFYGCSCCFCASTETEYGAHHCRKLDSTRALVRTSREISNYMLFLLVMRPFMMTASIGQIRFGDTCAEAKNFFRRGIDEKQAAAMLSAVRTSNVRPRDVKGDRSKSVLFDACRLAEALRGVESPERRWRIISGVWAEMLCYSAGKCRGNFHAKQLSQGGEVLTMVWLLMAHMGMGEQYRVESGHARAKLIIET